MLVKVERVSVFPEEKDREFTEVIWKKFYSMTRNCGLHDFALEIAEKYDSEETPHYHMLWVKEGFDWYFDMILSTDVEFSVSYDASADGETYRGTVRIRVFTDSKTTGKNSKLANEVFRLYDECIREYYPEWETKYLEETRKCGAITTWKDGVSIEKDCSAIVWN